MGEYSRQVYHQEGMRERHIRAGDWIIRLHEKNWFKLATGLRSQETSESGDKIIIRWGEAVHE